ncbi:hypothetical protein C0Q70_17797 [Pomacea canaliculata]|uniref:Fibrinogen C-terminal domain-containing protein n=1 Tax=Pomacea canaliculata TaxID=400727 RepID=A0A2T7NLF1_POMCA|nr:hypothetical protein C0Q70_17797 [Pomacea canaliculata]
MLRQHHVRRPSFGRHCCEVHFTLRSNMFAERPVSRDQLLCHAEVQPEVINEETTTTQTVDSTEPLWCENGGTLENGRCRCPIQYGGTTCQRLIRDCSEPYENGYRGQVVSLLIQPAGAVSPFWIFCVVDWGGLGYVLLQNNKLSLNMSWSTAKTGIGISSSVANGHSSDYFVGLDNLHYLLSQADYDGNVYCLYNNGKNKGWIYYRNIVVGSENTSYALSYQSTNLYRAITWITALMVRTLLCSLLQTMIHITVIKITPDGLVKTAKDTVLLSMR